MFHSEIVHNNHDKHSKIVCVCAALFVYHFEFTRPKNVLCPNGANRDKIDEENAVESVRANKLSVSKAFSPNLNGINGF